MFLRIPDEFPWMLHISLYIRDGTWPVGKLSPDLLWFRFRLVFWILHPNRIRWYPVAGSQWIFSSVKRCDTSNFRCCAILQGISWACSYVLRSGWELSQKTLPVVIDRDRTERNKMLARNFNYWLLSHRSKWTVGLLVWTFHESLGVKVRVRRLPKNYGFVIFLNVSPWLQQVYKAVSKKGQRKFQENVPRINMV